MFTEVNNSMVTIGAQQTASFLQVFTLTNEEIKMIETQEHLEVEIGSNRSFGMVFTVVFLIIGLWPLIGDNPVRIWSLSIAGIFLTITLLVPKILAPLNRLWFKFGMLLARIINPIVMFIIYVVAMLPIGLLLRLGGKDLLRQKLDRDTNSYWILRSPPGPEPESLTDQF
ncbi:MAG: SxtJ family membrane protein [Pseudomonadaceae bacterium]|nr:SxtJ family membrane protein [Pseudomonadaceae bacterium]